MPLEISRGIKKAIGLFFRIAGRVNNSCKIKQFPTKSLAASVAKTHVLPVYCTIATRTDWITVPMEQYQDFCDRQRQSVKDC